MPGRRVVLLEMATEDAEELSRIVAEFGTVGGFYQRQEGEEHLTPAAKEFAASVEAVVARPTRWCKCAVPEESRSQRRRRVARRESSWMRGKQFGWWICAHCGKPSQPVVLHWISSMLAGANDLLPMILDPELGPVPPSLRWELEGAVENPGADGNSVHTRTSTASRRKRKERTPHPRRVTQ